MLNSNLMKSALVINNLSRSGVSVSSDKVLHLTEKTFVISAMWIYCLVVTVPCMPDILATTDVKTKGKVHRNLDKPFFASINVENVVTP